MKPAYRTAGISRRQFLSYLVVPAALSLGAAANVLATTKILHSSRSGYLGFVDREGLGPKVDAPAVQNYFIPLHKEQPVSAQLHSPEEMEFIRSVLKSEFLQEGYDWDDNYEIRFSYQHFGVPDDLTQGAPLLDYCGQVYDFLYSRLNGLYDVNMAWRLLPADRYQSGEQQLAFQGYVGRYTYYVMRAYVDHPELDDLPSLVTAQPMERAIHYIVGGAFSLPKRATLYVIPGRTSLVAPFSELLHLTFHAPSQNYAIELEKTLPEGEAQQYAIDAGETINEATSILLAKEFIRKYGASERLAMIDAMANNLNHRFNYLHGAIAYIKRNGVQKSLDIYLENPRRFLEQLSKV